MKSWLKSLSSKKTMNDKIDAEGNLLSDELRLHKIGSFIARKRHIEI
jgi:hypothetical protein